MKGKRTYKERILVFVLSFVMAAGMGTESVHLQAASAEGEPVQKEIVAEEPALEGQPSLEKEYLAPQRSIYCISRRLSQPVWRFGRQTCCGFP